MTDKIQQEKQNAEKICEERLKENADKVNHKGNPMHDSYFAYFRSIKRKTSVPNTN